MTVRLITDTYPDKHFEGTLTAINPDLDAGTRSVRLQATFANRNNYCGPACSRAWRCSCHPKRPCWWIPATAVLSAPYGDSVYVIEKQHRHQPCQRAWSVRQQFIRVGRAARGFPQRGDRPETWREGRRQRRVQAAQRHAGHREQRAGAQVVGETEPGQQLILLLKP